LTITDLIVGRSEYFSARVRNVFGHGQRPGVGVGVAAAAGVGAVVR